MGADRSAPIIAPRPLRSRLAIHSRPSIPADADDGPLCERDGAMNEGALGLAAIDITIVLVYLAGVLIAGTFFARFVKSPSDLFLAGKGLPFWAIGMSIVGSDIGATDFIAVAGGTYRHGLAQANFDWIGSMPALLI